MARDDIYAEPGKTEDGPFTFNAAVAQVFPDMLRRSVPGYGASLEAIESLARRFVQPGTRCYDLGCSLGAATWAMARGIEVSGCEIVAVDSAPAMVSRCRQLLDAEALATPVDVVCADIREIAMENASMAVMNYTLQFVPPKDRQALLDRVAQALCTGGVLVLSEKIVAGDAAVDELLIDLHHDFKRQHAYSDLEISRKRAALENVLVPDTIEQHQQRLHAAGFRRSAVWLQHFNFVSLVAVR